MTLLLGRWQFSYFRDAFGMRMPKLEIIPFNIAGGAVSRNHWYYRVLPQVSRTLQADIVHLSFPAPIRRSAFHCPVLCSLHDLYPYDAPLNFGYTRVLFNRIFLRRCLSESDAVVCSSDFTLARLKQCLSDIVGGKTMRIYQAVDLQVDHERRPVKTDLCHQPYLLAVAQHRRNKNLHLLVEAFAELRRRSLASHRMHLIIVGASGPETGALHALVERSHLQQHVVFESNLPDAELFWLYRRCELMIVPSSIEGFCFPLVEALHCGSRVLCSDIPVLREVGQARCSYFDLVCPDPGVALAEAMEQALQQPRVLHQRDDRFSPSETAHQYSSLYSSLLAGTRQPAPIGDSLEDAPSLRYNQRAG
jgi:glycosyltransferase involved in cell wall biosynthesis